MYIFAVASIVILSALFVVWIVCSNETNHYHVWYISLHPSNSSHNSELKVFKKNWKKIFRSFRWQTQYNQLNMILVKKISHFHIQIRVWTNSKCWPNWILFIWNVWPNWIYKSFGPNYSNNLNYPQKPQ